MNAQSRKLDRHIFRITCRAPTDDVVRIRTVELGASQDSFGTIAGARVAIAIAFFLSTRLLEPNQCHGDAFALLAHTFSSFAAASSSTMFTVKLNKCVSYFCSVKEPDWDNFCSIKSITAEQEVKVKSSWMLRKAQHLV